MNDAIEGGSRYTGNTIFSSITHSGSKSPPFEHRGANSDGSSMRRMQPPGLAAKSSVQCPTRLVNENNANGFVAQNGGSLHLFWLQYGPPHGDFGSKAVKWSWNITLLMLDGWQVGLPESFSLEQQQQQNQHAERVIHHNFA